MDFYEVTFSQSEIKTLQDYLLSPGCPVQLPPNISTTQGNRQQLYRFCSEFLDWKSPNGYSNKVNIFSSYTNEELIENRFNSPLLILLKPGVKFTIPYQKVNRMGLLTEGFEVTYTDEAAFKAYELTKLESDIDYTQQLDPLPGYIQSGSIKEFYPDITVWVWCRALSTNNPIPSDDSPFLDKMEGELFDLTPFIDKLSTSVSKNGGNFQLSLPALICEFSDDGKWILKKDSIREVTNKNNGQTEYFADSSVFSLNTQLNRLERNQFLFHSILSPNDLVFIRFETLKLESDVRYKDKQNYYLNKSNLSGKIYDMIGLIDSNSKTYSPQNNSVQIQIQGRDLSKLFIEDGVYYYALENSQGKVNFIGGSTAKNPLTKRIFLDGDSQLQYIALYAYKPIDKVIEFILTQLSNIGVVPDSLFESYGDRRNSQYQLSSSSKDDLVKKQKILDSYSTDSKSELTRLRESYNLIITNINGHTDKLSESIKLNEVYQNLKNFLRSLREKDSNRTTPRIVNNNQTVGWRSFYYNSERLLPNQFPNYFQDQIYPSESSVLILNTNLTNLVSLIDKELDGEAKQQFSGEYIKELATGIWQIIKLVFDKSISTRRIVDSSLSSANGSLLNYIRKVCQEPFVEYYMDTYGDTYNLVIRRPPYNSEGITTLLQGRVRDEVTGQTLNAPVINIEELNVIQESLSFNDSDIYSWYRLTPQNSFTGNSQIYSTAYLPALYFPEYAEIWGSRAMDITHNYSPYLPLDPEGDISAEQKQAYVDLAYLVESSAYMPFTRKGTLVINGDRRIKIGNLIRYKPTGEVFLVEGVSNNYSISEGSIDRTTTIQVTRGMVERLIYGVDIVVEDGKTKNASYFNIINTNLDFSLTKSIPTTKTIKVKNPKFTGNNIYTTTEPIVPSYNPDLTLLSLSPLQRKINLLNKTLVPSEISPQVQTTLDQLSTKAKDLFKKLILDIQSLGYFVVTTDGLRSYEDQLRQFRKNPKQYHYKVPSIDSPHVQGTAIDLNLIHIATGRTYKKNTSITEWINTGVPDLAKSLNFIWGGTFSGGPDPVHFQIKAGSSEPIDNNGEPEFIEKEVAGDPIKGIDDSKILKNFRVDRDIFSFFLRKEQFNFSNS